MLEVTIPSVRHQQVASCIKTTNQQHPRSTTPPFVSPLPTLYPTSTPQMSQKVANKVDDKSSKELPPPRQGKAVRHDVDLPLENTSLSTVVYWVAGGVLLYLAYYSLVIFQW